LCVVDEDCGLTDREVQLKANEAKNFAKAQHKGRIALFNGDLFRGQDLVLVEQ
jgi:hypothetical protein